MGKKGTTGKGDRNLYCINGYSQWRISRNMCQVFFSFYSSVIRIFTDWALWQLWSLRPFVCLSVCLSAPLNEVLRSCYWLMEAWRAILMQGVVAPCFIVEITFIGPQGRYIQLKDSPQNVAVYTNVYPQDGTFKGPCWLMR